MAKKLQGSLAVEGELPGDALAAYGDEGDDTMMALARKLVLDHARGVVSGEEKDGDEETVEEVFARVTGPFVPTGPRQRPPGQQSSLRRC